MSTTPQDSDADTDALATLDEEQRNIVQMREISRKTLRPGVIRLPVKEVSTAENSDQWAVDVQHPFKGTQRFFFEKPVTWDGSYDIEKVLRWYDIRKQNPYHLQLKEVCVAYDREADEWEMVEPPEYDAPIPTQLKRKLPSLEGSEARAFGVVFGFWAVYDMIWQFWPVPLPEAGPVALLVCLGFVAAAVAVWIREET